MKIMLVIPNLCLGGAETMVENLSEALNIQGHSAIVVSLYSVRTPITERLEKAGVKVIYLNKKLGLDFSVIYQLWSVFKKEKPDVVHSHLPILKYVVPAAVAAGIKKRVHTVHNIATKECSKKERVLAKFFYKYFHVVPVALSNLVRDTIVEEYNIKKENIPVIFNGVNLDKCVLKKNYELTDNINLLHIGRFVKQKNHICLIDAFQIVREMFPNARLTLIGDGELVAEIKRRCSEKGLEAFVNFAGLQGNVYPFLGKTDIFVLPSLYEGIPMTLIEAMGTGLPIVSTKVGGIPDMLEDGVSALLTEVTYVAIADAIIKLINDSNLRKEIGNKALDESYKFSSRLMAAKYLMLYSKYE